MAAIRGSNSARLISICDAAADRAEQAAYLERCKWTGSLEDFLADDEIDAVIVCTPNITHEELGSKVLFSGRHLLMEKPLAMTLAGAEMLAALASEKGLALAVGHSHRFSDQGLAIRAAIDSGSIGTPRFVRIVMNGGWIWAGWGAWVLDPAISGGHSLHNGVHLMDLASWWLGEQATTVSSRGQRVTSSALQIHDYLVTELGFASGSSAVLEVSRGERPRSASLLEITVVGTDGVILRDWDADGILAWFDQSFQSWSPNGAGDRTFSRELASFVSAASDPSLVNPPVADAVHVVELGVASELSLAAGETVQIGAVA